MEVASVRRLAAAAGAEAALENAFRCPTEHLEAYPLFTAHFASIFGRGDVAVVSPDIGGLKRAERFRTELSQLTHHDVPATAIGKQRIDHVVSTEDVVGGVRDRVVVVDDDMIATGSTLLRAARACRKGRARKVFAAATHGLFLDGAQQLIAGDILDGIVVADTVPPFRLHPQSAGRKLVVLDTTPLVADAIRGHAYSATR